MSLDSNLELQRILPPSSPRADLPPPLHQNLSFKIKIPILTLCAVAIASSVTIVVLNKVKWDDDNALNLTMYSTAAFVSWLFFEAMVNPQWKRPINNWANNWLLEMFEFETQRSRNANYIGAILNKPNFLGTFMNRDLIKISVASLAYTTFARMIVSLTHRTQSDRVGLEVLHPTTPYDCRITPLKMLEGPHDSRNWIVATTLCKLGASAGLITTGVLLQKYHLRGGEGCVVAGALGTGYALSFLGKLWPLLRRTFQRPESGSRDSFDDGPRVSVLEGAANVLSSLFWDHYPVVLGALIVPNNVVCFGAAGFVLGCVKDVDLREFQTLKLQHQVTIPNLSINREPLAVITNLFKLSLVSLMGGWIVYGMTQSELPSFLGLSSFSIGLVASYLTTLITYHHFHSGDKEQDARVLNQLYFYAIKHPILPTVIFSVINKMIAMDKDSLNHEAAYMKAVGIIGLGFFGTAWGNNRALSSLIGRQQADIAPLFLPLFLLGNALTQFYAEG